MDSSFLPQYAAQAVADMEKDIKEIKKAMIKGFPVADYLLSLRSVEGVVGLIRSAVHVVLPPNGEIYRDNQFGGAMPTPAEAVSFGGLPAPVTCFEYPWTHPKSPTDVTVGTKRITVVVDYRQLHKGPLPAKHDSVQIYSVFYHEIMDHWTLYPGVVTLALPLEISPSPSNPKIWTLRASYKDLDTGVYANPEALTDHDCKCIGEFRSDISAVVQCCHALRAGASLDEKKETSSSRRWKFDKRGVGGFTYHFLKIPTHPREDAAERSTGTHASPRFHIRRHHIRTLTSGALTFVRQCFVGDKERGAVQKNYEIKR